ncbi:hypothetical protein DT075_11895 [Bacillus licheniformis]|nr:hypothetical protein DT075_11895 [Bacillus licheniformis]
MDYRIEKDTMGEVKVPADKFWGAHVKKTIYCVTVVFGEIFIEQRRSEKVGANQAYGETGGD